MKTEIKIYVDTGADISKLEKITPSNVRFYQFPYDSDHRPRKAFLLAKPSDAQLQDGHITLNEDSDFTLDGFQGSTHFSQIEDIIGRGAQNRRDVLHFDSAFKTGCKIFLTSDKKDIYSKREELEYLTGIKTFCTSLVTNIILLTIEKFNLP